MTSVTQCKAMLNHVLNERANDLAKAGSHGIW
jgi:hypothetical protein